MRVGKSKSFDFAGERVLTENPGYDKKTRIPLVWLFSLDRGALVFKEDQHISYARR